MAMMSATAGGPKPQAKAGDGAARRGTPVQAGRTRGAHIAELLAQIPGARLGAGPHAEGGGPLLTGVHQDSRRVEPGDLFVALRGEHADGLGFVPAAVSRGAAALMVEVGRGVADAGVPCIEVEQPRTALARAAAIVYGRPTEVLEVVGITGTNGKTTTAHLVQHCLDAAGHPCGIVGTLGYRFADLAETASHTSPEADELQRLGAAMLERGASHLVMEVSSIALAAERVAEVRFRLAAFTNLTQDHLDYHGSMAAYAAAKDRLFFEWQPAVAVVNVDDAHGADLAARLRAAGRTRVLRTSCAPDADVELKPAELSLGPHGIRMQLVTAAGQLPLEAPLVGAHNVANLLTTAGILAGLGVPLASALAALRAVPPVPGRLERCDEPGRDDIVAVVDYAHTPDALERVLASVRSLTPPGGHLWCVFGCGGDRDRGKRGPMGEAVARAADRAILTNDNPRGEDPREIAAAVAEGLRRAHGRFEIELDRGRAIELAIGQAAAGDVVLVAGKGHEPYQIVGTSVASFDDRAEVRRALALRRGREGG
jgi:UDP-N-acetylmuramoyl-L-alanyl-D-glutamate--2,6-diaminopimelate ligase